MLRACIYDRLEIMQYLIDQGRKLNVMFNLNSGLVEACKGGHLKIVQFLIEQGANNFNEGLVCARKYKHLEVEKWLSNKLFDNLLSIC